MNRFLNLSPCCNVVSIKRRTIHHTLIEEIEIIIEFKDDYFIIKDEYDKVIDVSQMPVYIKEDWINYNKKPLDDTTINDHIKEYEDSYDWQWPKKDDVKETLDRLKCIKRDISIKKII